MLPVQVLEQLPEGVAIAVLAAPSTPRDEKLSVLPASLHPLAVEAAFFFLHFHRSLTLDFASPVGGDTTYKLLHAAITATSPLREIDLKHIPVQNSKNLLELIPVACKAASYVRLDYGHQGEAPVPDLQHVVQLGAALSRNAALTGLHFTIQGHPGNDFKLHCLTDGLTGLQSLSMHVVQCSAPCCGLPAPQHMLHLTYLQLGHGLNLNNLPQILPSLTRLQALHLSCFGLTRLPPLATLTALQTLKLWSAQLQQLPPLATLGALRTLELQYCFYLTQLPPLNTLTALHTLRLWGCRQLQQLPTELQTVELFGCYQVQQLPPLATLTALQTLMLAHCQLLKKLPPVATLTALQTLNLQACVQLKQLPPLATLTALQALRLQDCVQLRQLPPLATLTALQTLDLRGSCRLQKDFLKLPSTQGCKARPRGCATTTLHILRDAHVAAPTELGEHFGGSGERSFPIEVIADAPLGMPLKGFRLQSFIIKLRRASCFRLACCGVPQTVGPDAFPP
jgi:hypothetical protein